MLTTDLLKQAVATMQKAQNIAALTGAGVSTPSGIPDFRSPNSGLWEKVDIFQAASIYGFKTSPATFYNWVRPLAQIVMNAAPNPAHYALAALEQRGKLNALITQNVDNLHTRAGSQNVIEIHGHFRRMTCIRCYRQYDALLYLDGFLSTGEIPRCNCNGILKPNVILFGEQLPALEVRKAQVAAAQCEVMLVAGSSLEVSPACDLPLYAKRNGAQLIFVNRSRSELDSVADIVIHDDVAIILPQLAEGLEGL
jgi:NAD-dependent deacetylase